MEGSEYLMSETVLGLDKEKVLFMVYNVVRRPLGYVVVSGSHAYGLSYYGSDYDIRGFYYETPEEMLSFRPNKGVIRFSIKDVYDSYDVELYSFRKFMDVLKGGSPNVLELLVDPYILFKDDVADYLRQDVHKFISIKSVISPMFGCIQNDLTICRKLDERCGKRASNALRICKEMKHVLETGDLDISLSSGDEYLIYLKANSCDLPVDFKNRVCSEIGSKLGELRSLEKENTSLPKLIDRDWVDSETFKVCYGRLVSSSEKVTGSI